MAINPSNNDNAKFIEEYTAHVDYTLYVDMNLKRGSKEYENLSDHLLTTVLFNNVVKIYKKWDSFNSQLNPNITSQKRNISTNNRNKRKEVDKFLANAISFVSNSDSSLPKSEPEIVSNFDLESESDEPKSLFELEKQNEEDYDLDKEQDDALRIVESSIIDSSQAPNPPWLNPDEVNSMDSYEVAEFNGNVLNSLFRPDSIDPGQSPNQPWIKTGYNPNYIDNELKTIHPPLSLSMEFDHDDTIINKPIPTYSPTPILSTSMAEYANSMAMLGLPASIMDCPTDHLQNLCDYLLDHFNHIPSNPEYSSLTDTSGIICKEFLDIWFEVSTSVKLFDFYGFCLQIDNHRTISQIKHSWDIVNHPPVIIKEPTPIKRPVGRPPKVHSSDSYLDFLIQEVNEAKEAYQKAKEELRIYKRENK